MTKKIIRYCDKCGKETREFLKVMFYECPSKVRKSKNYDLCNKCARKRLGI
jgi:hypothetical protein